MCHFSNLTLILSRLLSQVLVLMMCLLLLSTQKKVRSIKSTPSWTPGDRAAVSNTSLTGRDTVQRNNYGLLEMTSWTLYFSPNSITTIPAIQHLEVKVIPVVGHWSLWSSGAAHGVGEWCTVTVSNTYFKLYFNYSKLLSSSIYLYFKQSTQNN